MAYIFVILCCFFVLLLIGCVSFYFLMRRHIIKRWFDRKKAIIYKRRKIKQSIIDESEHIVRFNVVLKDISGNHKFEEEFDIVIPAKASFFARKKLESWLKENVAIEIIDIKLKENDD